MSESFLTVTELPGHKGPLEQLERLYQRYRFASQFCKDKDVLEIACGAGQGLGYLAKTARKVVGNDIDENNLQFAKDLYEKRKNIELKIFDAEKMPFNDKTFDVVICYEAIYYFKNVEIFISEARRVLKDDGRFIICTVNKDWPDFNPSPFSVKYFSIPELSILLKDKFKETRFSGGFFIAKEGIKDKVISFFKRAAVGLHLMPKTMKGKELLKRLFLGKLYPLPSEIEENMVKYYNPEPISSQESNHDYKVIFVVAAK